jgi:hypothetical protein
MGGGGYEVLALRQINTCRKVPLHVNFLDDDIVPWIAFYESYISTGSNINEKERDCSSLWCRWVLFNLLSHNDLYIGIQNRKGGGRERYGALAECWPLPEYLATKLYRG